MTAILQTRLPFAVWMDPRTWRLPGILPVEGDDWLRVDDAYAAQMAERDRLIATDPDAVHALLPQAAPAADELFDVVLAKLARTPGYRVGAGDVLRPDGVTVRLDRAAPLLTLGRLVQEDLCLMERAGDEHALTGAILCFPASWTLAQKIGRPMTGIHVPVDPYNADVARRVQRLFDAIRPEQALWRGNALVYDDPTLHQPRPEGVHRPRPENGVYLRSERQCLFRLPRTKAVVFTIHTYVVQIEDLEPDARAGLAAAGLW
jgi:dimethylamine monooxygenase subunit A